MENKFQNNAFVPQGKEKTRGENTTGFINIGKNKNTPEIGRISKNAIWCELRDSNSRPLPWQGSAPK